MPQLLGEGRADGGQSEKGDAYRHEPVWLPAVAQTTGYRRHKAIEEEVQREHEGGAAAAPTEFIQNRGEEDREGMPDAVDEGHADDGDAENNPSIEKAWTSDHLQIFLLTNEFGLIEDIGAYITVGGFCTSIKLG